MQSKFTKAIPNFFLNRAQAQCVDPGSAFVVNINLDTIYLINIYSVSYIYSRMIYSHADNDNLTVR